METNFEKAFDFATEWEKWHSDDPNDPGGLTIWGVTWRYHPNEVTRMKEMSKEDSLAHAKEFYHREYWLKQGCDKIGSPLDIVVFDSSIVPGRTAANTFLMMTHDWRDYLFLRLAHFASSPVAGHYMRGWTNRVVALWRMLKDL